MSLAAGDRFNTDLFWAKMQNHHALDVEHVHNGCCLPPECEGMAVVPAFEFLAKSFPYPLLVAYGFACFLACDIRSEVMSTSFDFCARGQKKRARHVLFACSWEAPFKDIAAISLFVTKLKRVFEAVYIYDAPHPVFVALAYDIVDVPQGGCLERHTISDLPGFFPLLEEKSLCVYGTFLLMKASMRPQKRFWRELCVKKGLTTQKTLQQHIEAGKGHGRLHVQHTILWHSDVKYVKFLQEVTETARSVIFSGARLSPLDKLDLLDAIYAPDNWECMRLHVKQTRPPVDGIKMGRWLRFWVDFFHSNMLSPFEFCRGFLLSLMGGITG